MIEIKFDIVTHNGISKTDSILGDNYDSVINDLVDINRNLFYEWIHIINKKDIYGEISEKQRKILNAI